MAGKKETDSQHKEIYQKITHKSKSKESFSNLDLKTILNHLIRLPEVYKLDFLSIHLPQIFEKSSNQRDKLIYEHYKHYVSIPCLAALLNVIKNTESKIDENIALLIEHIKNLQLQPGPTTKDREQFESFQYDLITVLQRFQKDEKKSTVDLRSPVQRKRLAELYYDRILKSFISESEDDLISEDDFINQIRKDILKGKEVQEFASKSMSSQSDNKTAYLKELGGIINSSVTKTYLENYKGIFNGDRQFVLKGFEEVIENRFLDHEDGSNVDLDQISAGIIALTIELVFNSGIVAFRNEINQSIYNSIKEEV
jgi:hypothetical protein